MKRIDYHQSRSPDTTNQPNGLESAEIFPQIPLSPREMPLLKSTNRADRFRAN
jgi:hypothetical protein